ncbi:MAG: hypothetical protein HC880_18955 [Bacteroidia bacterium]|nr:hypothetical protein [Bacteroidia bacterium]
MRLDFIVCRNLLIYFKSSLQKKVLKIFHYSLRQGQDSYLLLGKSENTAYLDEWFDKIDLRAKIFRRKSGIQMNALKFFEPRNIRSQRTHLQPAESETALSLMGLAYETIAQTYEYPFIIINEQMEVIEIRGNIQVYTDISEGMVSAHILKLLNRALHAELRTIFNQVTQTGISVQGRVIQFDVMGSPQLVRLQIKPLIRLWNDQRYFVVVLDKIQETYRPLLAEPSQENSEQDRLRILQLEEELAISKEQLQTFIEELEFNNDELQLLNEELQSVNEALSSSNEELETSNEELQSVNEELETANIELRQSNEDLMAKEVELSKEKEKMAHLIEQLSQVDKQPEHLLAQQSLDTVVSLIEQVGRQYAQVVLGKSTSLLPQPVSQEIKEAVKQLFKPHLMI